MGGAAVLRDAEVVSEVSGFAEDPYSTRLFRDVASLQARAHITLDQVDVFAVGAGPGSFTGLRVGLTAVKAWAEVHAKPVAPVSILEAIAHEYVLRSKSIDRHPGAFIGPFLDGRRGQIFGAVYRWDPADGSRLSLCGEEGVLSPKEFLEMVKRECPEGAILASPTPNVLQESIGAEGLTKLPVEEVPAALAAAIGRLGFERARRGEVVDPIRLDANYVRRSDAEASWQDRAQRDSSLRSE